jgi:hypothetical protein
MYCVKKEDTNGTAFWLRIDNSTTYKTAYVVKNDFSNLRGFSLESLQKMATAVGYLDSSEHTTVDELCASIQERIAFDE